MPYQDLKNEKTFLQLVRLGIGHSACALPDGVDWDSLEVLAVNQGLSAIIIDGIEKLPESKRPPKAILLQWIGNTLQGYEYRYEMYRRAISEMAAWHNKHGFKMMVLKGYSCSLDWPKPEHRPCGDIDIWQFGKQKEADEVLAKDKGIKIDNSHHHHTIFTWRDFMVENHYDFIEVHYRRSSRSLESILKDKGKDDTHSVDVCGERVYIPSPDLHALFLCRHALEHFASENITIRHLLDWAFFVKAHGKSVGWKWLIGVLEQFGMLPLFSIINAICVEDLGFEAKLFPEAIIDSKVKNRVLNEILCPEFNETQPSGLLPRVRFKLRRWKANGWKHTLCYKESRWSAFWSGVWNHLLKPASI